MRISLLLILLSAGLVAGCASIIHGSTQEIAVSSEPSAANVVVDGQNFGATPLTVSLKRKERHTIAVSLPGYETRQIVLERRVNGWVWGNIVFGGLIGLVIDASTGAMYKIAPNSVRTQLQPVQVEARHDELRLHVLVRQDAEPDGEKIGQLQVDRPGVRRANGV